jgi:uncharacterized membrane protein YccF (DUF307 family)
MSIIGNLLWILLGGGIFLFIEYMIGGFLLCLTIIGIPFGIQMMKLSVLSLLPFGKEIVPSSFNAGCLSILMNVLWLVAGGVLITLTHILFGILCAITIIGIPFAKQHLKLAHFAIIPFGTTFR